jgi:hypothetical protein
MDQIESNLGHIGAQVTQIGTQVKTWDLISFNPRIQLLTLMKTDS